MFSYYLRLAWLNLRRSPLLTVLMVAAIALGIGASMTSLTVLRAMSGNPLAHKEGRVYRPMLDNWSPGNGWSEQGDPPNLMTYIDSMNLYRAQQGVYQAAMFPNVMTVQPVNPEIKPYMADTLFTHGDFFPMFDVPFLYGGRWSREQDERGEQVVVISRDTNEQLFGGEDSVGRSIRLGGEDFRVVGVLDYWEPQPRFYETSGSGFNDMEKLFMPFEIGIRRELQSSSNNSCWKDSGPGYRAWLDSECVWMAFWIELPDRAAAADFKAWLDGYVQGQKQLGRFERPLNNRLHTVGEWLHAERVVPRDAHTQMWMAAAFLVECLIITIGLLLAKFLARAGEIGLRRAVGASRRTLFAQFLTEAGVVGVVGALAGLLLTFGGLAALRVLYADSPTGQLARIDPSMVMITVLVAIGASVLAGLYPTWKACQISPAAQLKSN